MVEEDYEEVYDEWKLRQEKKEKWYNNIPSTPLIFLALAGLVLLFFFTELTEYKYYFLIFGILGLVIYLISKSSTKDEPELLEKKQIFEIVKEQISLDVKKIDDFYKKELRQTGIGQLQTWDFGKGIEPWRWIVPVDLIEDNIVKDRFCYIVHPFSGKVIGTEKIPKEYKGMEKPFKQLVFSSQDIAMARFRKDIKQGRTSW